MIGLDLLKVPRLAAMLAAGAACVLGACSGPSGGSSSLITGSIFSGAPKAGAAADGAPVVKPEDPMSRPVNVAWTSARAAKCGFYFDPAKLRQSFLTSQVADGIKGEQLTKSQQSYDTAYTRVSTALAENASYCTSAEIADIKGDLSRHLAGDFTTKPKPAKSTKDESAFAWLQDNSQQADRQKLDRNQVFFPSGGAQTEGNR